MGKDLTRRSFLAIGSSAGVALAMSPSLKARAARPTNQDMQRVDELLRQMTIEEKAMQLSCAMPSGAAPRSYSCTRRTPPQV